MNCAWKELLSILPIRLRKEVDRWGDISGQEIRLREGAAPELVLQSERLNLAGCVVQEDIDFVVNTASRYSPWAAATISKGYLTAPGGHRIGLCGEAVINGNSMTGLRKIRSICIRIARDFEKISTPLHYSRGSVLIIGAPGSGKTTFLRDLIRCASVHRNVCVVDERAELFPPGFFTGKHTDILTGCPKATGVEVVLRTMGPECIAVDEITASEDCKALINSANSGVDLLATVHATSLHDLRRKELFRTLLENEIFGTYVIMARDKSWHVERNKL